MSTPKVLPFRRCAVPPGTREGTPPLAGALPSLDASPRRRPGHPPTAGAPSYFRCVTTRSAGTADAAPLVDVVPGAVHEVVSDRALQLGAVVDDDVRERVDRQAGEALGQRRLALVDQVLALGLVELLVDGREGLVDGGVGEPRPVR